MIPIHPLPRPPPGASHEYNRTIGAAETNNSVIYARSCFSVLKLFPKSVVNSFCSTSLTSLTTSACSSGVGAHCELPLVSNSFVMFAPLSLRERERERRLKGPGRLRQTLARSCTAVHAFTHMRRPCSNPNIMSALSAFFGGPAKTRVLTLEEWAGAVTGLSLLGRCADPPPSVKQRGGCQARFLHRPHGGRDVFADEGLSILDSTQTSAAR